MFSLRRLLMEMPAFCGNTSWNLGNLIYHGKLGRDCTRPNIDNDKRDAVLSFVGVENSVGVIP